MSTALPVQRHRGLKHNDHPRLKAATLRDTRDRVSGPSAETGSQSAPTKADRDAKSVGDAAQETSTSMTAEETGGLGGLIHDDQVHREN